MDQSKIYNVHYEIIQTATSAKVANDSYWRGRFHIHLDNHNIT